LDTPHVSIIIPVKAVNDYIRESIHYIRQLDYTNFETLILPDDPTDEKIEGVSLIPSGNVGPAIKRNLGVHNAKGTIVAFLDDDAYPRSDWLKNAVRHFEDEEIAAVGGPAVTPEHDSLMQKASGLVYASWLASGKYKYRYVPVHLRFVDDFPSVNLMIRKNIFEKIGGFDTDYWPGEDTKLCLGIVKSGKKIVYDPDVFVYHHRRRLFREHLRQILNYAVHRGFFAKKHPENSLKFEFFIPSLFLIFIVWFIPASLLNRSLALFNLFVLGVYLALIGAAVFNIDGIRLKVLTALGIFLTHLTYGAFFMKGLFVNKLAR